MLNPIRTSLALADITGISPQNPRHGEPPDAAIDALAASIEATGLLQPLLCEETAAGIFVLDGRRRYLALQRLCPDGGRRVAVELAVEGNDADTRERALAINVHRMALHPVAEYEAFAALAEAGRDIAAIAAAHGMTPQRVRRALRLGRLAPAIRAAWRDGSIGADAAAAYASGATEAAQLAAFEKLRKSNQAASEWAVRHALMAGSMRAGEAEPRFVGEAAYLAAGGRLEDSLFAETVWLDGGLVQQLLAAKLARQAEDLAFEEGWGFVVPWAERKDYEPADFEPDYLAEEKAEIEALDDENEKLAWDDPRGAAIEVRLAELETKAMLRAIPQARRAALGLCVSLGGDRVDIERGLERRAAAVDRPSSDGLSRGGAAAGPSANEAPDTTAEPVSPSKTVRALLDTAITAAVAEIVAIRPDIAMALALATLTAGDENLVHLGLPEQPKSALLRALARCAPYDVDDHLPVAAAADHADIITAFAELVAAGFDASAAEKLSELAPLMAAIGARGGALAEAFARHLPLQAYVRAGSKQAALDLVAALSPETLAEAKKMKRDNLNLYAATLAENRHWLPEPLATWALPVAAVAGPSSDGPPGRNNGAGDASLAQAMADAMDADEAAA